MLHLTEWPTTRWLAAFVIGSLALACDEPLLPPNHLGSDAPAEVASVPARQQLALVTRSADSLAQAVRGVGNDNEIIVQFKTDGEPAVGEPVLAEYRNHAVIGLAQSSLRRSRPQLRRAQPPTPEARAAVLGTAAEFGVAAYLSGSNLPFAVFRVPDDRLEQLLTRLLGHPNVDFVEANQRTVGHPNSQVDIDQKHIDHFVEAAWAYTKGSGAKIGILDSGFAYSQWTGSYHPDGLDFGSYGVKKLGFADDVGGCSPAQQQQGGCTPWDDDYYETNPDLSGHGTAMVGLVGANDNEIGRQGIAPDAETYSLKVTFSTHPTDPDRGKCRDEEGVKFETGFCVEGDDLAAALYWVQNSDLDVLSISWSTKLYSPTVNAALEDAYTNGDVLIVASLGNNPTQVPNYFAANPAVMGVGGVRSDGTLRHHVNLEHLEVSGTIYGGTTKALCPSGVLSFCSVDDPPGYFMTYGGTSTATANVAGVAGLLRAYDPNLTAAQARNRLKNTAWGPNRVADAEWAIENVFRLWLAPIAGEWEIDTPGQYTWSTYATGGTHSYSYVWRETDWVTGQVSTVSNTDSYTRWVSEADGGFTLEVEATSGGRTYRGPILRVYVEMDDDCGGWPC